MFHSISKGIIALMIILFTTISVFGQEFVWKDFFDYSSESEAKATRLDSRDAQSLKKAGVYYFNKAHGSQGVAIDKKNEIKNAKTAVDYLEAAYKVNRKDPVIRTWYAASNLALAGVSKKLTWKIKYSNRGLGLFSSLKERFSGNLNYHYLRVMSFSPVPKYFKNLKTEIIKSGKAYQDILKKARDHLNKAELEQAIRREQAVHVYIADAEYALKNKEQAKLHMSMVDEKTFLLGNSKKSGVVQRYYKLRKKLF